MEGPTPYRRTYVGAPLLLALACLFAAPASAHYREPCWVQYRYSEGWSQTFAVTCDYASGPELNATFHTRKYQNYKTYVILLFDVDGPITVRIHQPVACGDVAERGCAGNGGNVLTGRDEYAHFLHGQAVKREWAICQPSDEGGCKWLNLFDSRMRHRH